MKINVQKVGGIWHGTIEGHPDVDVRALTEEISRRKVEAAAASLRGCDPENEPDRTSGLGQPRE
jgi:hypothetical protein